MHALVLAAVPSEPCGSGRGFLFAARGDKRTPNFNRTSQPPQAIEPLRPPS